MSEPKDLNPEPEENQTPPISGEVEAAAEPTPAKKGPDAREILEQHVQKSKMQRKATMRAGIAGAVILGLVAVLWKVVPSIVNSDPGAFASSGYLVAERHEGQVSKVVLVSPDGKIEEAPDAVAGAADSKPSWGANGERVYFISNRHNKEPHVYRWNPNPGKLLGMFSRPSVERRSTDSRVKNRLNFDPRDRNAKDGLMVSGGTVLRFNPQTGESVHLLPPSDLQGSGGGEQGRGGQFDGLYMQYGTGFLDAKWRGMGNYIVATMRMHDGGEFLVEQSLDTANPQPPRIFPLGGDQVDFDIDPVTNDLIIAIANARYVDKTLIPPDAIVDGVAKPPFRHGIIRINAEGQMKALIGREDDTECYLRPAIAPQGLDAMGLMIVIGKYNPDTKQQLPESLFLLGPGAGNEGNMKGLARGKVYEAAWHPNGMKIAFTMFVPRNKKISLCSMNLDGTDPKVLTGPEADYRYPIFSPKM